jgi:membrane-associated protein
VNSVLAASFDSQLSPLTPFLLYIVVWGLVFVETALLIGFFLPGDSILFSAGLVAAARGDVNIVILATGVFLVAFFGDQIAFVIGRHFGRPYLDKRQTPRRVRLIARSERFYERYGFWAVVIARYLPWVRTFVPVIAGVGRMRYNKFLIANLIGAVSWGVLITVAGFYAGKIPAVKNASYVLAGIFITLSIISSLRRGTKKGE